MKWQIKFIRNALFGLLPFPEAVRNFKRRLCPYSAAIDEWVLEQGIRQVQMLATVGDSPAGKIILELGTGWKPIIPIVFYLSGCNKILLIDTQRLLDRELMIGVVKNLREYKEKISSGLGISVEDVENKLDLDTTGAFNQLLSHFSMEYIAPCNILDILLPEKSVDIIISRAVLEHMPPQTVLDTHVICRRILKDEGNLCHIIDNSDHWEHRDKSISRLNFLKFSDIIFNFISLFNPLNYQNRLRHFEYVQLLNQAGFKIDYDGSKPDKNALDSLQSLKICKRYRDIPWEELAILTSYIVASKK